MMMGLSGNRSMESLEMIPHLLRFSVEPSVVGVHADDVHVLRGHPVVIEGFRVIGEFAHGHGAGRIEARDDIPHPVEYPRGPIEEGVALVSHTPENHRRIVPVPLDHLDQPLLSASQQRLIWRWAIPKCFKGNSRMRPPSSNHWVKPIPTL